MLLELMIGDAYGACFEFAPKEFVQANNDLVKGYPARPPQANYEAVPPGHYSDDTQMTMAVAEFMLSGKPLTTLDLADQFVETYLRDPRPGYARGFRSVLERCHSGAEFLSIIAPHSDRSGGAMRAAPIGLLTDVNKVVDRAMWQASLTHATRDGMLSAAGVALLVHLCRAGVPVKVISKRIMNLLKMNEFTFWAEPVRNKGLDVLFAAYAAILAAAGDANHKSIPLSAVLFRSVQFTGDVDTVAAVALAAASLHPLAEHDLPQVLFDGLENGPYGRNYIENLDKRLLRSLPKMPEPEEKEEETSLLDLIAKDDT